MDVWRESVYYNYHWTPDTINDLYHDDIDHFGLGWHYNTIKKVNDSVKTKDKNGK